MIRLACIIDGPSWWGHGSIWPDGSPVEMRKPGQFKERSVSAKIEQTVLGLSLAGLAEGCILVVSSSFMAGTHAASLSGRGVVAVTTDEDVVPLLDVACGLRDRGWKVKAFICAAPREEYLGRTKTLGRSEELAGALEDEEIVVRPIFPVLPDPEPDLPAGS